MLFARAAAGDRRRPDRGLDPPARPAGRARRTARLPRARRRRVAAGLAAAAAPRRRVARPSPGCRAGGRGPPVRERVQRLRHDPAGRGPRRHLRRTRDRDRAPALARDRRQADGVLRRAERPARVTGAIELETGCPPVAGGRARSAVCATARAGAGDEQALAKRYAPEVRLVEQTGGVRPRRALPAARRQRALRPADRCAPWPLERVGPGQDRADRARSHRRALRLPPRLPRGRALPGLRLRTLGPPHLRGARADGVRPRRDRARATPGSSPCSTGSSTSTTTGTTCTKATGR